MIIAGWISIVLIISIVAKKINPRNKELTRKIVHIGTGPVIGLAWWLKIESEIAILFSSIITIALLINYQMQWLTAIEDINRKSFGTIAYGLSITILLSLLWSTNPGAVCAGVLMMAFGDGLAGLIGKAFKSPTWKIAGQQKSCIGTLTMFVIGIGLLLAINLIQSDQLMIFNIVFIALIATTLEQIGPYGIDNLTVPICVSFLWNLMNPFS